MTRIRLTQLDGSLPNLALMNLHAWAKQSGYYVYFARSVYRQPDEPAEYDHVFASSIFKERSLLARETFWQQWPYGLVGGTGTDTSLTVEELIAPDVCSEYCYDGYPQYKESIGFTQRGCRLSCKFCVVPAKEGKPKSVKTIYDIWRGEPYPRKLHILDNDFFGQPEWRERIQEIRDGNFRICLSQGINVRMITEESAAALSSIQYRNTQFEERKLYTAWDNLRDEHVFFNGVDLLEKAGVPSKHLMAYMLIGFDKAETWERIWYRFNRMTERKIEPYAMLYDITRADLKCFARWVNRGLYRIVPWPDYVRKTKTQESVDAWHAVDAGKFASPNLKVISIPKPVPLRGAAIPPVN